MKYVNGLFLQNNDDESSYFRKTRENSDIIHRSSLYHKQPKALHPGNFKR